MYWRFLFASGEGFRIHLYRRLLDIACRKLKGGSLTVEYWDGAIATYGSGLPHVALKLRRPGVVGHLIIDPELAFGEAYTRGDLEIEGSLDDLITLMAANEAPMPLLIDKLFHGAAVFRAGGHCAWGAIVAM